METARLPNESDRLPIYAAEGATRFSHIVFGVSDLDRSEAWYRDVLATDLLGRDLTAEPAPHTVLRMNTGQLIILVENPTFQRPPHTNIHQGFMLTPSQYRRAYERLRSLGYEAGDTHEGSRPFDEYSIDVLDPDGHRLQLQTLDPDADQVVSQGVGVVDCGPAARYHVGQVVLFDQGKFFLVRLGDGFLALSRWCTHMNGQVVYQKEHWHFACPNHDATFDRCGLPEPYPGNHAGVPLRLHPVSFDPAGHVLVDTNRTVNRSSYEPAQAAQPRSGALSAPGSL
ncbi:MAG: cytochrome b6-f complex iron-sulfur subunit [Chloroflexota bacterium]|nr:cytochrome b6-f complex iron-sulfur subunit [Chloroflexota bacterium]